MSNAFKETVSVKFSCFMLSFILIVVMFHSGLRYHYPFIEDLTAIANSYFFCVSAFFFYKGLTKQNNFERWKKRIRTLIVPYLLWNFTYLMLYVKFELFEIENIIRGFTINNFCPPAWYLLTLFIFLTCSFFLRKLFKRKISTIIVLITGIAISYCGYILFQKEVFSIPVIGGYLIRMSEYLTPYLIGAIIGTWFEKNINTNIAKNIVGIIGILIIIILLFANILPGIRWLLWVLFPIVLWYAIPETLFRPTGFINFITLPTFFNCRC